jgi:hypothetical protein
MFDSATPNHPDPAPDQVRGLSGAGLALRLPADAYWQLVHTLRLTLPPPLGDSAEDLLRRDHAAIARIAALAPANAAEADVAAQFVAASEQWKVCLRLAQAPETSPQWAMKCRAQALAMMRQANSALRLVLRLQQAREKRDADDAARDRAAWTEHCALGLMAEALAECPQNPPPSQGAASPPAPAASAQATAPPPGAEPIPEAARRDRAELDPDLIAAAERYAAAYPERAAAIRRTGRLPCDVRYFDPPEAALGRALIAGRTPALTALDSAATPQPCIA